MNADTPSLEGERFKYRTPTRLQSSAVETWSGSRQLSLSATFTNSYLHCNFTDNQNFNLKTPRGWYSVRMLYEVNISALGVYATKRVRP